MSRKLRPLHGAFVASLLLHLLPFVDVWPGKPVAPPPAAPPLLARLSSPLTTAATPEFLLPESEAVPARTKLAPLAGKNASASRKTWTQVIGEQFSAQQHEGLFYPEEAIRLGLEGEALVLLMVDASGQVSAARIEESSGHPLLDEAALRAVRRLRALPSDTPLESLLPVRFRIK